MPHKKILLTSDRPYGTKEDKDFPVTVTFSAENTKETEHPYISIGLDESRPNIQ
jgi:hypothetical protein